MVTLPKKKMPPHDNRAQSKRFLEAAKTLECDDDKARFEKRLGKIAKAKPSREIRQKAK
jgi:hypothetical protein